MTMEQETLSERVQKHPLPAIIWVIGIALLLLVELARIAGGILNIGEAIVGATEFLIESVIESMAGGGLEYAAVIVGLGFAVYLVGLAIATWTPISSVPYFDPNVSLKVQRLLDGVAIALVLSIVGWLAIQIGIVDIIRAIGSLSRAVLIWISEFPTLTSRYTIPNQGYQTPDGTWHGTFMGLSPAVAWGLRILVIHLYVMAWIGWSWMGYTWYRQYYRQADWTPRDDVVRRLRYHRWGQFGLIVVLLFLTMALFAPSMGTTTADQNLYSPFSHSIEYYDEDVDDVREILVGNANLQTRSSGFADENVGPMTYDEFDRFHPFGTLTDGKDLFTFLVHGARVSLIIGLMSVGVSAILATVFALVSAYYRGLADLVLVVTGDTIMGIPRLLLLILLTVILADTWIASLFDGGILLALILAATGWPFLWRAFRGPTLQIAEEDWVDAARSYGQSPSGIMRLHMLPYLIGYLIIYSSLVLGGVILAVAGLSFLGLGITAPTPEWGRAVDLGRQYVATPSWHISFIPGIMVTLVVMGFNAIGDAFRDAVDPKSDTGAVDASETEARGGGV